MVVINRAKHIELTFYKLLSILISCKLAINLSSQPAKGVSVNSEAARVEGSLNIDDAI